jgi:hypothetical protein
MMPRYGNRAESAIDTQGMLPSGADELPQRLESVEETFGSRSFDADIVLRDAEQIAFGRPLFVIDCERDSGFAGASRPSGAIGKEAGEDSRVDALGIGTEREGGGCMVCALLHGDACGARQHVDNLGPRCVRGAQQHDGWHDCSDSVHGRYKCKMSVVRNG